ncbi:major facilitator superfamily domain-containing protein 10 isoform X2 [Acinonyx jubatus]|uniref:Major facilitator superfamily domain-containing protein 10 isoform X2 n=1 Tax=Acinonyx jubatus TaxID=32536 RepID=A0ABM3PPQ1_ACIJB|nr:major facilitator superfamily domain-containing protein 10 isoform X2 [Acinonyx jubatus]
MWVEVVRWCGRPPTWVRLVAGEASALPAGRCGSRGSPSPAACPGVPGSAQRAEPPRHWRARSRRGHPRRHEPVSGEKARRPLPTRPLSACRPEEEARRRPLPGREEAWPACARPRQCSRSPFRIRPSVRVSDRPTSLSARPRQDRSLALGYPEVPSCRPATLSARRDWSGPHHGLGSRRELHPAPTHPPAALVRAPCDHRGLPRPPAGPPGLHSAVASAARAAGEPWPCPRSPLWLLATRRGLVCRSHQDASGEEVQQCPVWRSDRLSLLLLAVPLGTSHGGCLRLSREAPGDAAVPGRSGHLVCRVGGLKELRRLPGLQGDWGHQQGKRQPLHSHRSRPGLTFCPQPRHVIGVAFSLAFTLGPMLGAFLPAEMVPWLALLFAASDLLFIFCFLPETLPAEKRASSIGPGFQAAADLLSPVALLRFSAVARGQDPPAGDGIRHLRRLGLVYFLYLFLFSGLEFTLSFLAHQRFQFSSLQQGKMFFFIGLTMATVQGAYARKISPGSEIAAVKRAILLLVPAFLLIGWGLTLPALGLGLLLYSFAAAVVVPCLSSVVADYGKEPFFARGPPGGRRPASTRRLPPPLPPKACPGRRARSWAHFGAWAPWPGQWDPWWLPQCTGWPGPGSASRCAQASSCSLSCSCAT